MNQKILPFNLQKLHFFVSVSAALCLFAVPSKIILLLEAVIFTFALLMVKDNGFKCFHDKSICSLFMASIFLLIGIQSFYNTLQNIGLAELVPEWLSISAVLFSLIIVCSCGFVAFPAFYVLSMWMEKQICKVVSPSYSTSGTQNLKSNWIFLISAMAYFFLEAGIELTPEIIKSILAALGVLFTVAWHMPPFRELLARNSPLHNLFCALTAAGVCLFQYDSFCAKEDESIISVFYSVLAFSFVFVWISAVFRRVSALLKSTFSSISTKEWILYGTLILVLFLASTTCFLKTNAFYGSSLPYDIIYTSDSPILVQENAYLQLTHPQNDLRQPLFSVFSAPFLGWTFLVSKFFSLSEPLNALFMNYPQILVLFTANLLLSSMLDLTGTKRICFLIFCSSCYPVLLFSLMMEQYIFAYFYLILFFNTLCHNNPSSFAFYSAGGTLLTSMVVLPFVSARKPVKQWKVRLREILDEGISFVIVLLAFGRLEVILGAAESFLELQRFASGTVSKLEILYQYTTFIANSILATAAGVTKNAWGDISWQLDPAVGFHWGGICILVLAGISAAVNRRKRSSHIAIYWILFSFVILFVMGWGSHENGQILYTLYFGWPFWLLLYQLMEKIESLCNIKYIASAMCILSACFLSMVNISAIVDIVQFSVSYYPT